MAVPYSSQNAAQAPFLKTVGELVRTYQAFASYSEAYVRQYQLTPAQFDVIATLGNTQGMAMGDIGDKTLITKGTLTGIVDRLIKKGLVTRTVPPDNRRTVLVQLTAEGEALFQKAFPAHIADMKQYFDSLDPSELELLRVLLQRLRHAFP